MPPRLCGTAQPWFPESWAFLNLSNQFQPFQRYYDLNLNCFSQSHVLKLWSPSSRAISVVCEAFRWWTLLARGEPLKVISVYFLCLPVISLLLNLLFHKKPLPHVPVTMNSTAFPDWEILWNSKPNESFIAQFLYSIFFRWHKCN